MMHQSSIYPDNWVSRKKRVHTVYSHQTHQWSHWTELQDAIEQCLEDGSTRILFCGNEHTYLFQFVLRDKPKEPF